jgi:ketosteroid isomerase-like protein
MSTNQQVITAFYSAFQQKDYQAMQQCYADDATFNDAVFKSLNAKQVKGMWQMLCKSSGADFKLEFNIISAQKDGVIAQWVAHYSFSATGNKVVNRIKANFTLRDGKIVTHVDDFDFYAWAKQALGLPGLLFGWLPFFKTKVQKSAMGKLNTFMSKNKL